jgi:hypothetical protein
MGNPHHQDDKHVIVNLIDYPIIADSNAVGVPAFQLLATGRARGVREVMNVLNDPPV